MSTRLQAQTKATSGPTPSFTLLRTGLPQRKPAFDGTPGPTGESIDRCRKPLVSQLPLIQAKPTDRYEQEAEQVADDVIHRPEPDVQRWPNQEE